jgi:hypothetical protein
VHNRRLNAVRSVRAQPPHAVRHSSDDIRPETHRFVPDPEKPPRSGRPARSRQHAARALDPRWVGWHMSEETPRRAGPREGGWVRSPGLRRQVGKRSTARGQWHIAGKHPAPPIRNWTRPRPTQPQPCLAGWNAGSRACKMVRGVPSLEGVGCRGALRRPERGGLAGPAARAVIAPGGLNESWPKKLGVLDNRRQRTVD